MTFVNPYCLLLLLLLIPFIVWYVLNQHKITPEIKFSSTMAFAGSKESVVVYLRHLPFVLSMLAAASMIVAIARPQLSDSWRNESTEGINIIMTLDISSSMLAEDLKPNRLEAAKSVAATFISDRSNDNIGLVAFSGESFTQCPLTINHAELINLMKGLKSGMIEDGTAIGSGLATAINRIKDSEAKSKVIILLTDGSNNRGEIAPVTAAQLAQTFGIRVYTIGVGTMGTAPYPQRTPMGIKYIDIPVEIDEDVLRQIASTTGGEYFRATDNSSLQAIYKEIDKLEKSKINVREFSKKEELYHLFAIISLLCIALGVTLKNTILRSIP